MNELPKTNSTLIKLEATPTENQETSQEVQSNCQGYMVNHITKLHLCNACEYHKYWNKSKPWIKDKKA